MGGAAISLIIPADESVGHACLTTSGSAATVQLTTLVPPTNNNTCVCFVAVLGFEQLVFLLLSVSDGSVSSHTHLKRLSCCWQVGHTPLHLACQNGHIQSSKVLLLGGSRPDSRDQVGPRLFDSVCRRLDVENEDGILVKGSHRGRPSADVS